MYEKGIFKPLHHQVKSILTIKAQYSKGKKGFKISTRLWRGSDPSPFPWWVWIILKSLPLLTKANQKWGEWLRWQLQSDWAWSKKKMKKKKSFFDKRIDCIFCVLKSRQQSIENTKTLQIKDQCNQGECRLRVVTIVLGRLDGGCLTHIKRQ